MKSLPGRVATRWLLAAAWVLCSVLPALAQSGAAPASPPASIAPATAPAEPREETIYIPYKKLRDVFEREGRGVFLPYDRFAELWKSARERGQAAPDDRPPVDSIISETENEATVGRDVVSVASRVKIEILKEGWSQIPLRLGDAAVTRATIAGEPARIVADPAAGYTLLIEKKGPGPRAIELNLEYAKAFAKTPGQNSVTFDAPQAPISRWRVRVPGAGVKVNIRPLLAATEAPADAGADQTVVLAFVGATPSVRLEWTPRAEGATGLEALASAQVQQQVWIEQGVNRTRAQIAFEISRAQLSQLAFEVPADQKVVSVFDNNVRQWAVAPADGKQRVTVQLFEPAKGTQNITLDLERFAGDEAKQDVAVPVIKALGVGRQQGVVVVQVAPALRAEVTRRTGLLQVDPAELPPAVAGGKWDFAYRYAALPFDLALAVERVEPRITVDMLVEATIEPELVTLNTLALFNIERAGLFRLELDIPAGYEVRQVTGRAIAGAQAAVIDTHHLDGANKGRLVVNLSRKALGKTGLDVELVKRLSEPDLLSPTGKSATVTLPLPRAASAAGIERQSGRLVVYAPESLRVNPGESTGLRGVSINEALEGIEAPQRSRGGGARPTLAFTFTQEPASLALAAERRKPQVNVRQLLLAQVEPGEVTYTATFNYEVLYSGVKSVRIDLPAALAGEFRNRTPSVRERLIEPAPADLAPGDVAWSFTGDSEFLGNRTVTLTLHRKIEKLDIGTPVDLKVPVLRPREVDRAWGQVVLTKAETIDVQPAGEPVGVRPIDPQRDVLGDRIADAARAFEFHDDWSLVIAATRYKLEDVKRTSIEEGVVRGVMTRGGEMTVHAAMRVRSVRQGLNVKLPAGVEFDTPHPLRLNGKAVSLGQGDTGGIYVIPLAGQRADEPFLLELRYTVHNARDFEPPSFPEAPAAQRLALVAYLPQERALVGYRGPWASAIDWRAPGLLAFLAGGSPSNAPSFWRWKPSGPSDAGLLASVHQGIPNLGPVDDDLRTDGLRYVFTTPRPLPAPDGNLHLVTWDEATLSALVSGLVLLGGLVLLRYSPAARVLAAGALVVTVVLVGVFLPTFALQALDGVFLASTLAVAVIWLVHYVAIVRPRDPLVQAMRREAIARREAAIAGIAGKTASIFKRPTEAAAGAGGGTASPPPPSTQPPPRENPPAAGPNESATPKE